MGRPALSERNVGVVEEVAFVTGANEKYFLLCGMLLESLRSNFPGMRCFVMDLGLSDAQRIYFEEKNLLLNVPPGLSRTDHPYKLKSCMASFLNGKPLQMSIWVDCDIVAVRDGSHELLDLANTLISQNKDLAISADEGPNQTLEAVCNSFGTTRLLAAIADKPSLKERRYLNAGLVVFSNPETSTLWQAICATQDGDKMPDQNALNIICHQDLNRVAILDSSVWNAHGGLLKKIRVTESGAYCDGQKPIFVHATSGFRGDYYSGTMPISERGYHCEAFLKLFANDHLRRIQEVYLARFFRENFDALRDCKILTKISNGRSGRNQPCPCGSGKKFKHCHGAGRL
jgi:hypothetical protein